MTTGNRCPQTGPHPAHRTGIEWDTSSCPGVPVAAPQHGLTDAEHTAMDLTAQLWNTLSAIAGDGPARSGDLAELATHIHAIQHAIMAQAAARAHPDRYRLMGGHPIQGVRIAGRTVP
ncbi:hypothetical protein [Micromonospora aurantiaca (nom. illeg.)]|uniref:hypothetical protein n=1 Tax=Micromonospora aurantiaca (nom. illeg.) TaxID=47850 RepID=UPI00343086AE